MSKSQSNSNDETITTYKGFGHDWKCRDFQYKVGESYEHKGTAVACKSGFHACEHPLNVFDYYPPVGSKFAVVEQSGVISRHDSDTKVASSKIAIKAEVNFAGLAKAAGDYSAASNTGDYSAASNTGYQSAASNTGDYSAASNTGYQSAASNTGEAGVAMASGTLGRVMGAEGNALFLVHRDDDGLITHARAAIVGREGIKSNTWYCLNASGEFEETTA